MEEANKLNLSESPFERISLELTTIDKAKAEELLSKNTYDGQRPIKNPKVNEYAAKMMDGRFLVGQIVLAEYKGKEVLADGQHTLTCVVSTDTVIDATIQRIRCKTDQEMGLLFNQFEGEKRSVKDSVRAFTIAHGIGDIDTNNIIVAGLIYALGYKGGSLKRDEKINLLREFPEFRKDASRLLCSGEIAHIKNRAVVGTMFLTHQIHPDKFLDFWEKVRDGDNLGKNDPRGKLRDFLLEAKIGGTRNITSVHEFSSRCRTAWNAFIKGSELEKLRYSGKKALPKLV